MKSNYIYDINSKSGIRDIASDVWTALSNDKILLGIGMIIVLSIAGYAMDRKYSLKMCKDSIDIRP